MKIQTTAVIEMKAETETSRPINVLEITIPAGVDPDSFLADWLRATHIQISINCPYKPRYGGWLTVSLAPQPKQTAPTRRNRR